MGNLFLQHVNLWWTGRFCKHCYYNFVWKLFNNMHCTVHRYTNIRYLAIYFTGNCLRSSRRSRWNQDFWKNLCNNGFCNNTYEGIFQRFYFIYNIYFWFKYFLNNFWNSNLLTLHFNLFENKSMWNKTQNWRTY